MEKYSVLMSLYYRENADFLKRSIESMIKQTIIPDEIVLVEDGKLTDELYEVLDEYILKYPKLFTLVKNEKNLGLGLSLRKGLIACRNEIIARMDTDDISKENRCEKQLTFLSKNPYCDIVGGQISEFMNDEENIVCHRIVPTNNESITKFLKKRCPFNHMTVMFRKSSILKAGNYEHVLFNEDYYLWAKMAYLGMNFANIDETLVNVRISNGMYKRRGGIKYFKSELIVQKYLLNHKIINHLTYFTNCLKRFVAECLIPSWFRLMLYKMFLRKK